MKYVITYSYSCEEPYSYKDNMTCIAKHSNSESYAVENVDACKDIIKNLLDVPMAELSLDEVKKDFSSGECKISEENAKSIQQYYNGRLELYKTIMNAFNDKCNAWQLLKYNLPKECLTFMSSPYTESQNENAEITIQKC